MEHRSMAWADSGSGEWLDNKILFLISLFYIIFQILLLYLERHLWTADFVTLNQRCGMRVLILIFGQRKWQNKCRLFDWLAGCG